MRASRRRQTGVGGCRSHRRAGGLTLGLTLVLGLGAASTKTWGAGPTPAPLTLDEEGEAGEGEAPEEGPNTRVSCLDQLSEEGQRRKGVQKRDFLKRHKFELSGVGGYYASDVLSSTYTAGAALAFFPAEDFGLELLGSYTPMRFRLEQPFSSFDQARRFEPSSAVALMGGLLFSPFHAKFKLTDDTIVHGDLFVVGGGGRTFTDSVQGFTWQAGLGLQLYLMRRLSFRLDVRDFISPQEVLGRARITHNIGVMGGFGVWL